MAREKQPPRLNARPGASASPHKMPMRIPLNDDREEKAVRFQSRQALHEKQINSIKAAAATPVRKRKSLGAGAGSPMSPTHDDKENDSLTVLGGNVSQTQMQRVPILANFEEWMKMATDNKINAANSWNFALIDYFHDMSLLREGDSVNFQKASCTLDGCVKIYTSRVDSVATETGKLLSGLADSDSKKRKGGEEESGEADGDEEEEEGEDGVKKKQRKKVQRSSEATLASSFAQLQLKKMDLEFAVDPLFKKASADFDEGGAKGLLLNHLTIDPLGRIVFDSSDDIQENAHDDVEVEEEENGTGFKLDAETDDASMPENAENDEVDIDLLGQRFFPDLSKLDEQDICPSLKTFELEGTNNTLDIPFLNAADESRAEKDSVKNENDNLYSVEGTGNFEDDDNGPIGDFDMGDAIGFGEGGEVWAREAAIEPQKGIFGMETSGDAENDGEEREIGEYQADSAHYGITLASGNKGDEENILNYFDQALQKNWAGPEHWRIRKIKDSAKPAPVKRKEKEPFEIDFNAPLTEAMADAIYTQAATTSSICLPKSQWKSKTRNLLPDDKHFNSRQLLRLFLKPKARIGAKRFGNSSQKAISKDNFPQEEMDGAFWAQDHALAEGGEVDGEARQGDYDANFFQDDGLNLPALPDDDDDDFADARETFSPVPVGDGMEVPLQGDNLDAGRLGEGFGTQLVTQSRRLRPEYVQYARVAKKVDVRRLKEEMWKGIDFKQSTTPTPPTINETDDLSEKSSSLKFTSIMNGLQSSYPKQAIADISTSYCFICLLHLANEKGLILDHNETFEEIRIQKDPTAEMTEVGA